LKLAKDDLFHRSWQGDSSCPFCGTYAIDHLFVQCPIANSIWKWIEAHNNFSFEGYSLEATTTTKHFNPK
jgi:zinc-binding in reverse transcriptase